MQIWAVPVLNYAWKAQFRVIIFGRLPLVTLMEETNQEKMRQQLSQLLEEHRDLDDVIARIHEQVPFDQLQLQRMKKRKLMLKDSILKLESELLPDIIA